MLQASQILGSAELHNLKAAHGPGVAAARALYLEGRLETHEIGSRADVFGGHAGLVTHEEQEGNKAACGNRAQTPAAYSSSASDNSNASSTSTPRYLTVLSSFVWPRSSWQARRLPVFL
jgi:hypothetical protein